MTVVEPKTEKTVMGIEERFDAPFVARLALREKQVQQSYRPIISIHKWFARRPGSLFRSLLLAEFGTSPLSFDYVGNHDIPKVIADPFMGGGTTAFEGLRLGLSVVGSDVNPMAYWLVKQAVGRLDLVRFRKVADEVQAQIREDIGEYYRTECTNCGHADADVKYFLWVKICPCPSCGETVSLLPGFRIAEAVRHPREVYHCPKCDALHEIERSEHPSCPDCSHPLGGRQTRGGTATCGSCDHSFKFATQLNTPPAHRLIAIEYNCRECYQSVAGRQFKTPDPQDHKRASMAQQHLGRAEEILDLPEDEIPPGDETSRLLRWGYTKYRQMFTDRQLLGLGLLMRRIREVEDTSIRHALATVFSDFLRYQNLLCRYDTYALKCQDIFSVHGFPVGLMACENNLVGIPGIGSGSFVHFIEKYVKAKTYAQQPYETIYEGKKKRQIAMSGESIEAPLLDAEPGGGARSAWLSCTPSQTLDLAPNSLDGVFTDPPYFDMVQYSELMDFCYVWLRRIVREDDPAFATESTRSVHEVTGNATQLRGHHEFTQGLSAVFQKMAFALKPGAPFVFTYHHNDPLAYVPLVVAILDAGLVCTAVLPAPGEMAASLHIAGTKSSILDSVFVCRQLDEARPPVGTNYDELVEHDVTMMRDAGYEPTLGDRLCLQAGHIAASAVRALHEKWQVDLPMDLKVTTARSTITAMLAGIEAGRQ